MRPYDARMWCAMAGCYKLLGRKPDAIKCYQRAEESGDREGIAFIELARLFREENNQEQVTQGPELVSWLGSGWGSGLRVGLRPEGVE